MENRIAVVATVVSNPDAVERVNMLLHEFRNYIIGRLGIPSKERAVSVITVVLDAPSEKINTLSGKLGMLENVTSKVLITK